MNITWVYPAFLLLIPLLLVLFLLRRNHHVRRSVARPKVKHLLASPSGVSKSVESGSTARRTGGWFGLIALCLAAVTLARPQWGEIEQRTYERSREVIIALDLSRSMLATDVSPNRLDRAKLLVDSLVKELDGERIGLVVFAGTSFVQYPLSNDYEILREMLKEVNPSYLPQQGTDFGKLLQTAYKAFDFSSSSDRFLIVLSDGEDLAGDWETELKKFEDSKIHIISLGIGTAAGSVLPEEGGGVIKDEKGAVVLSRLDSRVLQELATKTAGRYVDAYRWVDLPQVISETVDQGERGEFAKKQQILKVERFQIPLGLALLFAFLSLWRDFPVYPRHSIKKPSQLEKSLDRHARKKGVPPSIPTAAALLLLMLCPLNAQQAPISGPSAPQQSGPGIELTKLSNKVQKLSSMDDLSATDYAQLAEDTISYGKAQQQAKSEIQMGAIDDALMGVDEGEAIDAKAADWPKLRKELEELKKKASDQQQKKQDQKKQDKKDQDKNKDQKQDQQKQDSGSGQQDKDKQKGQDQKDQNSNEGKDQKDQQGQGQDQKDSKSGQSGSNGQDNKDQQQNQQGQQDQNQPKDGKDPKDQKDQQNQGQDPKDSKDQKDKQDSKNQPQPQPGSSGSQEKKEGQPETKAVGGGGSSGQKKETDEGQDMESAEMARKLDQIKQKDSPGKIYQLFTPQEPTKEVKGKTW